MAHSLTPLLPRSLAAHPVHHTAMDTHTLHICLISSDLVRLGGFATYGLTVWVCVPGRELIAGCGTHKQAGGKSVEGWVTAEGGGKVWPAG